MNIAILGTRGIPNNHGGFEQFAEYLSLGLVRRGHQVTVYNSSKHPYKESLWEGVKIKHIFDPENKIGTIGQFLYDFLSILHTRKNKFDIILQLGYTSSSVSFYLHPKDAIVITNMDGLEWKRSKYSKRVQRFLQWAEALAVKKSDSLISDSIGIQNYLKDRYKKDSTYIPYGAKLFDTPNKEVITTYSIQPYEYNMLIARLEPENSIEVILNGIVKSSDLSPFLVIGKHKTKYGKYLKNKFSDAKNIRFMGGIYDITVLNNLRYFSNIYFHGHTVGGTNPSLLEAMASSAFICANNNEYNARILGDDAVYFSTEEDISHILKSFSRKVQQEKIENNRIKIMKIYDWENIINQYESLFQQKINS